MNAGGQLAQAKLSGERDPKIKPNIEAEYLTDPL